MILHFLGAGKMATALAAGIVRNALIPVANLHAYDVNPAAREAFTATTGIACTEKATSLDDVQALLVAVKPQVAAEALKALPPLAPNTLVISICAGIPIAKISALANTAKVIRVMPNTPLMVAQGASCYALGPAATADDAALVQAILGSLGVAFQVDESQLDAVTALSGSGPAYFFAMIEAMTAAGTAVGLDPKIALDLTIQTMAGAAEMLKRGMGTPEQLRIAVTSPHGTTEAGLNVLRDADFNALMAAVVTAARDRSVELGRDA